MIRRCLFVTIALVAMGPGIAADESFPDLVDLLGLTLAEAYGVFGAPQEVSAFRGEEAWHDDVVFYYERHIYLFWFQNRVWQLRVDHRFEESFFGIQMGFDRDAVIGLLGVPFSTVEDSLVYQLEDEGYPVRLRLIFGQDGLADAYLYRADF